MSIRYMRQRFLAESYPVVLKLSPDYASLNFRIPQTQGQFFPLTSYSLRSSSRISPDPALNLTRLPHDLYASIVAECL